MTITAKTKKKPRKRVLVQVQRATRGTLKESGEVRSRKVTSLAVPAELANEFIAWREAYAEVLGLPRVTNEQVLRRWMDRIGRETGCWDKDVATIARRKLKNAQQTQEPEKD